MNDTNRQRRVVSSRRVCYVVARRRAGVRFILLRGLPLAEKRKTVAKHREADELGAFVQRMFRALVRRAADGDLLAVEVLADLQRSCAESTREAGEAAWKSGYSYTQVGDALGITRQGARQRFAGRRHAP